MSQNFTAIVSKMRALGQKNYRGGGRPTNILIKSQKFHGDSVKNESAGRWGKK